MFSAQRVAMALSGLGLVTDMYDISVINLVRPMLERQYGKMTPTQDAMITTAALFGCIVGQVIFGSMADKIGRRKVFIMTATMISGASLGSSLVSPMFGFSAYEILTFWRLILGIGIGGEYPLAASVVMENVDPASSARAITAVFSNVVVGSVFAPLVVMSFTFTAPSEDTGTENVWRGTFAFGCLLSLFVALLRFFFLRETRTWDCSHRENRDSSPSDVLEDGQALHPTRTFSNFQVLARQMWREMLGTGGSWLLYDIVSYGIHMYTTSIFPTGPFGMSAQLTVLFLNVLQAPAFFAAMVSVKYVSLRSQLIFGLVGMSLCFIPVTLAMESIGQRGLLIAVALSSWFDAFGGGVCTYVIPAQIYPTRLRGTAHGVSSATGKVGAVIGSFFFPVLIARAGVRGVFIACTVVGFLAALWTWIFVPVYGVRELQLIADKEASGPVSADEIAQFTHGTLAESTSNKRLHSS